MRALAMVIGFGCCAACVSRPALTHDEAAQFGADGGAAYADASGPLRPPDAPLSASAAAAARQPGTAGAAGFVASFAMPLPPMPPAASQLLAGRAASPSPPPTAAGSAAPAALSRLPVPSRPGQLVITEIMIDPKTLPDTEGEWFELQNVTDTAFDLQGCVIDDGAKEPRLLATRLVVQPLAYLTIARHEQPGFTPDYVATLSFTNGADTLAVRCREIEIDRVTYDKAQGFPVLAGASLALDPSKASAAYNDAASAWCAARASYGPELGTPGQPNPMCDVGEDAGAD